MKAKRWSARVWLEQFCSFAILSLCHWAAEQNAAHPTLRLREKSYSNSKQIQWGNSPLLRNLAESEMGNSTRGVGSFNPQASIYQRLLCALWWDLHRCLSPRAQTSSKRKLIISFSCVTGVPPRVSNSWAWFVVICFFWMHKVDNSWSSLSWSWFSVRLQSFLPKGSWASAEGHRTCHRVLQLLPFNCFCNNQIQPLLAQETARLRFSVA